MIPRTVKRERITSLEETFGTLKEEVPKEKKKEELSVRDMERKIKECEIEMKRAAKELNFEEAARFRDLIRYYQNLELLS